MYEYEIKLKIKLQNLNETLEKIQDYVLNKYPYITAIIEDDRLKLITYSPLEYNEKIEITKDIEQKFGVVINIEDSNSNFFRDKEFITYRI